MHHRHASPPQDASVERSVQALLMLEGLFVWLLVWKPAAESPLSPRAPEERPPKAARVEAAWWALVQPLSHYALHPNPALRTHALEILKRMMMSSESLELPGAAWLRCFAEVLTPLTGELAGYVSSRAKSHPEADKSLRLAVTILTKTAMQYMPAMLPQPGFAEAWSRMLVTLQAATKNKSEELAEAVPESVKNMLLVMAAQGVLVPEWRDAAGHNLWDLTWAKAKVVSQGLTPTLLASSSIPGFAVGQARGSDAEHVQPAAGEAGEGEASGGRGAPEPPQLEEVADAAAVAASGQ